MNHDLKIGERDALANTGSDTKHNLKVIFVFFYKLCSFLR